MNIRLDVHGACSIEGDGCVNEDFFGWTDRAAWVLDGATGVSAETLPYPSDAYWLVRTFSENLHRNLVVYPNSSTLDLINRAIGVTRDTFNEIARQKDSIQERLPSAAFVMVRILGDVLEITSVGDCKAIFRGVDGVVRTFYDPSLEPFEDRTLSALRSLRARNPESEQGDLVKELKLTIQENRKSMNQPGGYRVLSLNDVDKDSLEATVLPCEEDLIIALASDGFLRYTEVFGQSNVEEMYELVCGGQVAMVAAKVRDLESCDANCQQYIRVKKSDDATCVTVKLSAH